MSAAIKGGRAEVLVGPQTAASFGPPSVVESVETPDGVIHWRVWGKVREVNRFLLEHCLPEQQSLRIQMGNDRLLVRKVVSVERKGEKVYVKAEGQEEMQ